MGCQESQIQKEIHNLNVPLQNTYRVISDDHVFVHGVPQRPQIQIQVLGHSLQEDWNAICLQFTQLGIPGVLQSNNIGDYIIIRYLNSNDAATNINYVPIPGDLIRLKLMRTKASKALDKLLNKVGSIDSKSITSGDIEELKSAQKEVMETQAY